MEIKTIKHFSKMCLQCFWIKYILKVFLSHTEKLLRRDNMEADLDKAGS